MLGPAAELQLDPHTRRFLRAAGRPLPVLVEPTPAAARADPDLLPLRTLAGHIRQHALDALDVYLDQLCGAIESAGGHVHLADDAAAARRLVADLSAEPATVVGSALCDEVGLAATAGPVATAVATAVVGAAFAVAESGQACLASDDPALPAAVAAPLLVCLMGIESVVPRSADLAVMLKLLARSALGRPMTAHTALVGPRPGRAFHLVLLDNGRTTLLAGAHRDVLRCIGCGACTAICPVYRRAGVRPAGPWSGPVGAVVLPLLRGGDRAELPHASTLCGACAEVCPVRIDLPTHLLTLRQRSPVQTRRLRWWAWVVRSPARYKWATRWRRWQLRRRGGDRWPTPPARSFHDRWRDRPT